MGLRTIKARPDPPLTGGSNATSSSDFNLVPAPAYSSFTATASEATISLIRRNLLQVVRQHIAHRRPIRQLQRVAGFACQIFQSAEKENTHSHGELLLVVKLHNKFS